MKDRKDRIVIAYIVLAALVLVGIVLNLCIGSVNISLKETVSILMHKFGDSVNCSIISRIRLPRTLAAFILGGALALAGYLLQNFFHNPIAGPFVLGISSSAKLFVALMMVIFLKNGQTFGSAAMIISALAGALVSMVFVLLLARKMMSISLLIVGGIMVGYICTAVTDFVVTFADDSNIVNLHNWSRGSFSGMTMENVYVMTAVVLIAFIFTFMLSKPMAAYQLGEDNARSLGVNVKSFRIMLILLSSILAAVVTAFAGPISFVGIAVPWIVKVLLKTAKPIFMIPACFLGGGVFCLLCDLVARTIFAPTELSISTVTAVFGAPVVIYMLLRRN